METEKKLIEYIMDTEFEDLPNEPIDIIKTVVLTVFGSIIGGATTNVSQEVVNLVKDWGGKQEATILTNGAKVPAHNAAFANGTMARSLDYEDAMHPGIHVGPVSVPVGLATAELAKGCSGKEFITSLVLGTELASRLNLINVVSSYDGFDPTGVCAIFAGTVIAGRILRLNSMQIWDALALAFNKSSGSLQSNVDGAEAVGFIAGSAAQNSLICTQLAKRGITGPRNFLDGSFGYFHLYAKSKFDVNTVTGELGKRFELMNTVFKKYPSCGLTQTSTQGIFDLIRENNIDADDVANVNITVGPFAHSIVGNQFELGGNFRVNAQFSIQYCVANAILRRDSQLQHFEEECVKDPKIMNMIAKINVIPGENFEKRGGTAMDMELRTKSGTVYQRSVEIPRGAPGNEMTREEHIARFHNCISYGGEYIPQKNIDKIISRIYELEEETDICDFIPLLLRNNS